MIKKFLLFGLVVLWSMTLPAQLKINENGTITMPADILFTNASGNNIMSLISIEDENKVMWLPTDGGFQLGGMSGQKLHSIHTGIITTDLLFANEIINLRLFNPEVIQDPMSLLSQINGYAYNGHTSGLIGNLNLKDSVPRMNYVFAVNEIRKIFPGLVSSEENLYQCGINYMGFIPILVEAIKEQNQRIEEMEHVLSDLLENNRSGIQETGFNEQGKEQSGGHPSDNEKISPAVINGDAEAFGHEQNSTGPILYQNIPNPFSERTEIKYFLPKNISHASVCIFDLQGTLKQQFPINGQSNSVIINGNTLNPGMYIYSLVCNGKIVDTKRMVLTK